jgi:thiol-disulfide isomerase/thioredoxin
MFTTLMRVFFLLLLASCFGPKNNTVQWKEGLWRLNLGVRSETAAAWIRVLNENLESDKGTSFYLMRGNEELKLEPLTSTRTLPMILSLHVYNAELRLTGVEDGKVKGEWVRKDKSVETPYPFTMELGPKVLFDLPVVPPKMDLTGRWRFTFNPGTKEEEINLGIYEQKGNDIEGSIATLTGDFGYQQGSVQGDEVFLTAFDGSVAYVIRGKWENDKLTGTMSTVSSVQNFVAVKDLAFQLPDASLQTKPKNKEKLSLKFPSVVHEGMIGLGDARYLGKPVIVQIYGSWCPNCLDETVFLTSWYRAQGRSGPVEILSLAFEKAKTLEEAKARVRKTLDRYGVGYEFVIASFNNAQKPEEVLPIENFISYPTMLFLDKNHKIVKIHAGFSGPSTKEEFEKFKVMFDKTVKSLVR